MHRVLIASSLALVALAGCTADKPAPHSQAAGTESAAAAAVPAAQSSAQAPAPVVASAPAITPPHLTLGAKGVDASHLHNLMLVRDDVVTGSRPEALQDLELLRAMGVTRIISVDGAGTLSPSLARSLW
jgi:hypothetical protein